MDPAQTQQQSTFTHFIAEFLHLMKIYVDVLIIHGYEFFQHAHNTYSKLHISL